MTNVKIVDDVGEIKEEAKKFERHTRIEKSSNNRTIKNLYKNRSSLRFDLAIQRNEVWSLEQKSLLIHSILYGYPIPPVMVQETDDEFIWFLDGKQRLTAIIGFINGDWALSKKTPEVFGHDISGCKFSDLTEDIRDVIYDETIQLIKLKNVTDIERDEMFVRWNSGSTLSKIELTRAMHSDLIEQINRIAEMPFFAEDIALTGKARNRFVDQEIILQIIMLLDNGKEKLKGFGSAQIKDYVLKLKDEGKNINEKTINVFSSICEYLSNSVSNFEYPERRQALKKIHIPMIFITAMDAMKNDVKPEFFGDFIKSFLITKYDIESKYGQACQVGSSKKDSVLTRLDEMMLEFKKFVVEQAKVEVKKIKKESSKKEKESKGKEEVREIKDSNDKKEVEV